MISRHEQQSRAVSFPTRALRDLATNRVLRGDPIQALRSGYATKPHVHRSKESVCCLTATDGNYRPKPLTFHWACNRILRCGLDIRYFRRLAFIDGLHDDWRTQAQTNCSPPWKSCGLDTGYGILSCTAAACSLAKNAGAACCIPSATARSESMPPSASTRLHHSRSCPAACPMRSYPKPMESGARLAILSPRMPAPSVRDRGTPWPQGGGKSGNCIPGASDRAARGFRVELASHERSNRRGDHAIPTVPRRC